MAIKNLIPNTQLIPWQMHNANNWVAYELKQGEKKLDKKPVDPHTGYGAKANDPSTWGSIYEAIDRAEKLANRNDIVGYGIGFELGESTAGIIAGVDIDHCVNEQGEISEFAMKIIESFRAYTEYSPSGTGIHIFFSIDKPFSVLCPELNIITGKKNDNLGLEIYCSGRFFTFTGHIVSGYDYDLNERTEQAKALLQKYFQQPAKTQEVSQRQTQIAISNITDDDSELLKIMFKASNGYEIQRLFNGDKSGYDNDDSRADLALCSHLAFYTNCDSNRIDSMFRQSGLMREKWNREDYRQRTIEAAIAGTRETYTGKKPQSTTQQPAQTQTTQPQQVSVSPESEKIEFKFNAEYLDSKFESDMKDFQRYSERKTGFANLDYSFTLYPSLIVLGAMSSLGKSTFCLQLADQLAMRGEHVLYFALEQTQFELVSKSLARLCQPEDCFYDSAPTAIDIRRGRITPELRKAMQKYKEFSSHCAIVECDFMTNISRIKATVEAYIEQTGVKPVVFVDYLQLIRPANEKLTNTKDIVDENIRALKLLQMKHELVMFVVSSINRENYLTTIDFSSFKESGGIEFTADVVLGLQLAVMNTKLFEMDSKTTKKRKVVKESKNQVPRRIELCVLKNRYGISNTSFFFAYYPKWDTFNPATAKDTFDAVKELIDSIPDDEGKKKPK